MLKKNKKYVIILLGIFAVIVYLQVTAPEPENLNKTFKHKDKIAFGCSAFFDIMEQSVFKDRISIEKNNIYKSIGEAGRTKERESRIFINDNFAFDDVESEMLLEYVEQGNKVLLAASSFEGLLADTMKLKTNVDVEYMITGKADSLTQIVYLPRQSSRKAFAYARAVPPVYFESIDTIKASVIAANKDLQPVLIKVPFGKGVFYFLSTPEIFANYNFANHPARELVYLILSYLDTPMIKFDEYYKTFNPHIESDLQFILSSDALYAAYSLVLLSLLVYVIVNIRRRQRPIPVVTPPANSTLEFVQVIGNVYYNSKNHKIIADEKIKSFLEMIRVKFQVNTQVITDKTLQRVSSLSGIELAEVSKLFGLIEEIDFARQISESQLIELNNLIEQFIKNNKR